MELITSARVKPAKNKVDFVRVLKGIVLTFAYFIFCAVCGIAVWYTWGAVQHTSYKAVAIFLILIIVSNVTSKYLIWWVETANPTNHE